MSSNNHSSSPRVRKRSRSSPPGTKADVSVTAPNFAKEAAAKHARHLRTWFLKLTPEERGRVLSFEDKEGTTLLRQMYETQSKEGDGLFFAVGEDFFTDTPKLLKPETNFCFKRLTSLSNFCFYPDRLLRSDKLLENSLRLCDTREYLDTLTVASDLLEDGRKFLQLMDTVSRGNFLSSPCKVAWDVTNKVWVWDEPKWFSTMGYYSLGTWVAHKIEKALWMRYWDSQRLDPRKKQGPKYVFPKYLEGLLSKTYLINFWRERNPLERRKMVGSLGDLVRHVITNISENDKKGPSKMRNPNLDYTQLLSALVDLSTQERSIELLFSDSDLAQNEKTFIEVLYFSPLDRAGATIDMVLRRVGMSIHSAYSEKMAMDLIVGEEAEKIKKAEEGKKKRKKKKNQKVKEKKTEIEKKAQKSKEKKEKEEKERKDKERQQQEQLRKEREVRKAMNSIVFDIIAFAEAKIDQKKKLEIEAEAQAKRKAKPKKKKKKPAVVSQRDAIATNATASELSKSKSPEGSRADKEKENLAGRERDAPHDSSIRFLYQRREDLTMRLHQEVEEYVKYTKLAIDTTYIPRAEAMIAKITATVTSIWGSATVRVYGSYATLLCIPSSDLDLVVMGAPTAIHPPGQPLRLLGSVLRDKQWVQSMQIIDTAKVPIIKLLSHSERLATDIAVNDEYSGTTYCSSEGLAQHSGVAACELVKKYMRQLPYLTPMILVLKQYLFERGLNTTVTGINSFLLTLMVISFLQLYGGAPLSDKAGTSHQKKKDLGTLLIEFLDYYGRRFDYENVGITIINGGSHFSLKDACFHFPPAPMVVVDPYNPVHNLAHSAYGIPRVKAAFADGYCTLVAVLDSGLKPSNILNRIILKDYDLKPPVKEQPKPPSIVNTVKQFQPPACKGPSVQNSSRPNGRYTKRTNRIDNYMEKEPIK